MGRAPARGSSQEGFFNSLGSDRDGSSRVRSRQVRSGREVFETLTDRVGSRIPYPTLPDPTRSDLQGVTRPVNNPTIHRRRAHTPYVTSADHQRAMFIHHCLYLQHTPIHKKPPGNTFRHTHRTHIHDQNDLCPVIAVTICCARAIHTYVSRPAKICAHRSVRKSYRSHRGQTVSVCCADNINQRSIRPNCIRIRQRMKWRS